jgi:hydroxymethylpyrimidine pyrophosphatase-like HAD family hydrolase
MVKITVPVRRYIEIPLTKMRPEVMRDARANFQRKLMFAFDLDMTIVPADHTEGVTTSLTNRPGLYEIAKLLELGIPVVIATGNDMARQQPRVIPPLKKLLTARNQLPLLSNFHLFANNGASRLSFNPDGKTIDGTKNRGHCSRYEIDKKTIAILKTGLREILPEYVWDAASGNRIEVRRCYKNRFIQLGIKPFPKGERRKIISDIISILTSSNIPADKYTVEAGGSTTIDILHSGVNKALALRTIMREIGIEEEQFGTSEIDHPVYYFGNEFWLRSDERGGRIRGNDLSVLRIPNVIAFAVNAVQSDIPSHPRLIEAGSGPQATLSILRYFSWLSELHRSVPDGIDINNIPAIKVPVYDKTEIDVRHVLSILDSAESAIALRINSLLIDPLRVGSFADSSTTTAAVHSSALVPLVRLLDKGIKIVLLSGDARERQLKVVNDIYKFLSDKRQIRNLILYANGGATKIMFSKSKDDSLKSVFSRKYSTGKKIDTSELMPIAEKVLAEYHERVEAKAKDGDQDAKMSLLENHIGEQLVARSGEAQLAIQHIMPGEKEWVINRLKQLLEKNNLDDYVVIEASPRTIDINHRSASKVTALNDYKESRGVTSLLYLGTEFYYDLKDNGAENRGNDMEVLEVDNLVAIGLTPDQEAVHKLHNSRIIAGGSGAAAASIWLDHMLKRVD